MSCLPAKAMNIFAMRWSRKCSFIFGLDQPFDCRIPTLGRQLTLSVQRDPKTRPLSEWVRPLRAIL